MKIFFLLVIFCLGLFSFLPACATQTPSVKTAHSLTSHFFKKYAKKYPQSIFGQQKMNQVSINDVEGQSLNMVQAEAFLNFDNGQVARVLLNLKQNPPFGWSVISWEMVDLR